jgi:hyperosmotically inducible protein
MKTESTKAAGLLLLLAAFLPSLSAISAGKQNSNLERRSRDSAYSSRTRERLERQVRHELVMLPFYSVFDNLEFRVNGYTVELYGQTIRPTLKSDAEAVVKDIEGVERVNNHIEVLPLSFSDDRIRLATYRAIYSYPGLDRYGFQPIPSIHIIVRNGNVTLTGVVDTQMDKNVAYLRANGVSGVFSVTNQLCVEHK